MFLRGKSRLSRRTTRLSAGSHEAVPERVYGVVMKTVEVKHCAQAGGLIQN